MALMIGYYINVGKLILRFIKNGLCKAINFRVEMSLKYSKKKNATVNFIMS